MILTFDGADIADTRELVRVVGNSEVGKAVRVVVFRDGETQTILVTLGRREDAEAAMPVSIESDAPAEKDLFGMILSELTEELRGQLGLDDATGGLVIKDIGMESAAYDKGCARGDLITEAGQQRVATMPSLRRRSKRRGMQGASRFCCWCGAMVIRALWRWRWNRGRFATVLGARSGGCVGRKQCVQQR